MTDQTSASRREIKKIAAQSSVPYHATEETKTMQEEIKDTVDPKEKIYKREIVQEVLGDGMKILMEFLLVIFIFLMLIYCFI